ncbi:MAG: hypothetical protein KAY32_07725 [Candidatus Eisenbacteria sp.]|nr:hypothetical protein [Candidatus Eisenbacteria bacterium]
MKGMPTAFLVVVCFLAAALYAPGASADPWAPTAKQPAGGRGFEIALSYGAPTIPTFYACVHNHDAPWPSSFIYKSMDYGESWEEIFRESNLYAVETHLFDPEVVFVGRDAIRTGGDTGLYRSLDGGGSWQPCQNGIDRPAIGTITIAPSDPDVVYAGAGRCCSGGKLYRSIDRGDTWTNVLPLTSPEAGNITEIVIHPCEPKIVFFSCVALYPTHRGIYKSSDGGDTWRQVFNGTPIYSLAMSETDPDVLYAGGSPYFLMSTDGGETWSTIATLPNLAQDIQSIALHPTEPDRIWISRRVSGVWYSEDGGYAWAPQNNGIWVTDMWYTRLTLDPLVPDCIYAGEYDAGFFQTSDGGQHWRQMSSWQPARSLNRVICATPEGFLCALSSMGTPEISPDGGFTWSTTLRSNPLSGRGDIVNPAAGVFLLGLAYLPTADSDGWRELVDADFYESRILRSDDWGYTWSSRYVFPGEARLCDLASAPSLPDRVYGTGVYYDWIQGWLSFVLRSEDGGVTWDESATELPYDLTCLAVDSSTPDLLYFGGEEGEFLASRDGGVTLEHRSNIGAAIRCLVVNYSSDTGIYAGTSTGVYRSGDGGHTWVAASTGIACVGVQDLVIHPEMPCWLWAVAADANGAGQVYVTEDSGQHWIEQGEGLPPDVEVRRLDIAPPWPSSSDRELYAATSEGVYHRQAVPNDSGTWDPCPGSQSVEAFPTVHVPFGASMPNPFRDWTSIRFEMPAAGELDVRIVDVAGRQVRMLASGRREVGPQVIRWDGRDDGGWRVAAGVYQCLIRAADGESRHTMVLAD